MNIPKNIKQYDQYFKHYTELRIQENRVSSVSITNGDVTGNSSSAQSGVSARVYKDGHWGFSSAPEFNDKNIEQVVKSSNENVGFLNMKDTAKCGLILPESLGEYSMDMSTKKNRENQKFWVNFAKEIDGYLEKKFPELLSRNVMISGLDMEKSLATSDGSKSYSMTPRSFLVVSVAIEKDQNPVNLYEIFGGLGQMEDNLISPNDYFLQLDQLVEKLKQKADGVFPKAGLQNVIMDADLAGILAHEAIGHTTEADLVLGGSVAGDLVDQEVVSPLISLIDYANTCENKICPVPVYVDDEGTASEDAVIIKDGVLKKFMHNKESAQHFETNPDGNARAYAFSDEPLIRMRNTAFVPGSSTLEEMISSIDDGYYLTKSSNGQADSTSEFMFGIAMGYEIKNGKIGNAIKETTISGIAFDVLKTVDMVSSDMSWSTGGMCGKKQWIPVGMGGPAIKCKVNIGGR